MLKLKLIQKKNPKVPEEPKKFYASAVHANALSLDDLATAVSDRCSLRRADVHGVLVALMDIIPNELIAGKVISLGNLGSFYVNVKSEGAPTEDEFAFTMVKGTKIVYRPTKELRKKLRMIDVSLAS